jgi:hypothetical protein
MQPRKAVDATQDERTNKQDDHDDQSDEFDF